MLKAYCTWGEGEDILLVNEQSPYMLYDNPSHLERVKHGLSFTGSVGLSLSEAKELLLSLQQAINVVEQLEQSVIDYFEGEE